MSHYKFIKHGITISQGIEVLSKIDLTQYLNDENIDHLIELLKDVKYKYPQIHSNSILSDYKLFIEENQIYFNYNLSDGLYYNEQDNVLTVNAYLLLYYKIVSVIIINDISFQENQIKFFDKDFPNRKYFDKHKRISELNRGLIVNQLHHTISMSIAVTSSSHNIDKFDKIKARFSYTNVYNTLNKLCYVLGNRFNGYNVDKDVNDLTDDFIDEEFLNFDKYELKRGDAKNDAVAQLIIHNLILESPLYLIYIHDYYKYDNNTIYHNFVLVDQHYLDTITASGCSYSLFNINLPFNLLKKYEFPEHLKELRNKIKEGYYQTKKMKSNIHIMNEYNELFIKFFETFGDNRPRITLATVNGVIDFVEFEATEKHKNRFSEIERFFTSEIYTVFRQSTYNIRVYKEKIKINTLKNRNSINL